MLFEVDVEARWANIGFRQRSGNVPNGARGKITFIDQINDVPYPYTFNGRAGEIGGGLIVGSVDLTIGRIVLGNAVEQSRSSAAGIGIGVSAGIFGTSSVVGVREVCCD